MPGLPTDLVGVLAGAITDVPASTVEALVESLRHDMVCHDVDWTYDLLPLDHRLVGVAESFARALTEPDEHLPPAERDPMGPMPGDTKAETVLGDALKGERRESLDFTRVLTTGPGGQQLRLSRQHIMESMDGSLKRLTTEYVDLYQAHRYDTKRRLRKP